MLYIRNKKAQSTLEYILVLSAVVGVIIYGVAAWVKPSVKTSLENANKAITNVADKF